MPNQAFQQNFALSSSTPQNRFPPQKSASCATGVTPLQLPKSSTENSSDSRQSSELELADQKKRKSSADLSLTTNKKSTRFGAPIPNTTESSSSNPQVYKINLTPKPSITVTVEDQSPSHEVSDAQLERILDVIGLAWAQSTKETYGAGLLVFHVFCDTNNVAEENRCPVSRNLLLDFLCSCAGSYSGSALANYAAGLKAWHLLHGRAWQIPPSELKAVLDGATASAPKTSKRPKRLPFTPAILCSI
ncbi:hypothetical protein P692DRAFT_201873794 [Suillus brevipes Sb2]|nr:hypothetical protein P692DRAFT_201873794 [Suillus brevipes Sb2]